MTTNEAPRTFEGWVAIEANQKAVWKLARLDLAKAVWNAALASLPSVEYAGLVKRLELCADDPMWADHCEMSKPTVLQAADAIRALVREMDDALFKADNRLAMYEQREALVRDTQRLAMQAETRAEKAESDLAACMGHAEAMWVQCMNSDRMSAREVAMQYRAFRDSLKEPSNASDTHTGAGESAVERIHRLELALEESKEAHEAEQEVAHRWEIVDSNFIHQLTRDLRVAQRRLKMYEPIHSFDGLTIEQWKERAERAEAKLAALLDAKPDVAGLVELGHSIRAYLSGGGLFNPELANKDAVRDLIIDCRSAILSLEAQLAEKTVSAEMASGQLAYQIEQYKEERIKRAEKEAECAKAKDSESLFIQRNVELVAECEGLRQDAERGRYMIRICAWHRRDDHDGRYASLVVQLPYDADLSCVATRENAIDAANASREKP